MILCPAAGSRPVVSVSRMIWRINGDGFSRRTFGARILASRAHPPDAFVRELVGALVLRMSRVTFDPMPRHVVARRLRGERFPEILILHGLLVRRAAAAR